MRMSFLRSFLIVALVGGIALGTAGCGSRESAVETGNRTQTLHIGNLSEPVDLDPQIITSLQDFNIVLALGEGLTQYDPQTCLPVPGVAERWESADNARTWTFHLRPDARWSNGDTVTAHDFVYAFQRILSPAFAAEYAYLLGSLQGAENFLAGRLTDFSQVGAQALDDHTLQLTLAYPMPFLPGVVAHSSWYPVHRATIEKFGRMDQRGSAWTRPANYVGNGPFILKEWTPNQVIVVEKSPTYWDAANVRLNAIHFYPIESTATEEAAFRSGQLHVTSGLPIDKIATYKTDPSLRLLLNQEVQLATYFYRFNVAKPPFDDIRVRRALSMAIDRERLVEFVTKGGQIPAYNLTPPDTAGYTAPAAFESDLEEARRLLADAGYPAGAGFPKVDILFNTSDGHRRIAEAIQQMWRTNLGIDVGLYNQEAKVYVDTMRQGDYTIGRYAWVGDYLDPSTFLELMTTDSGNNQTNWSNPDYDRLIAAARETTDQQARFDLYRQAEAILMEESPIAPIYFYVHSSLKQPSVQGWFGNLLDIHPYNRVYLAPTP